MNNQDNIKVWDLEICKNVQLLKEAQNLILYGAADKGQEILRKLQDADIKVNSFCDSDPNRWNRKIDDIDVISPFMLEDYFAKIEDSVYVIACVAHSREVKKILNHMKCNDYGRIKLISYWGITAALYINRDILYRYDCRTYQLFLLLQEKRMYEYKNYAISILNDYITNPSNLWLILPGKTASTTLAEQLLNKGIPILRRHILDYPYYILGKKYHDLWNQVIAERIRNKIKVIVSIREPLSRDYSAFWQAFSNGLDYSEKGLYLSVLEKDFQKYYENYMNLILSGNAYMKSKLGICTPYTWGDEYEWMDDQIKKCLNVNIYEYPFDKEKGYSIIKKDNIELFIYRMENLKEATRAIEKFVGVSELPEIRKQVADDKEYGLIYKQFRNEVKLSREYVNHYYDGNRKMDHFYSKEEQQNFLKQWENQIK